MRIVEAPRQNLKVTTAHDLRVADLLLRAALMLTDYHTHLRPDVADTPPERYFTEANVAPLPRRPPASAASRSSASPSTCTASGRRSTCGGTRSGEECALDSLDEYVEFLSAHGGRSSSGWRSTGSRGARSRSPG